MSGFEPHSRSSRPGLQVGAFHHSAATLQTHTQAGLYPFSNWFEVHIRRGFTNCSQKESNYSGSQSQARYIGRASSGFGQPQPESLAWVQKWKASITNKWSNIKYIHSQIQSSIRQAYSHLTYSCKHCFKQNCWGWTHPQLGNSLGSTYKGCSIHFQFAGNWYHYTYLPGAS